MDLADNKNPAPQKSFHLDHVLDTGVASHFTTKAYDSATDLTTYTLSRNVMGGDISKLKVLKKIDSSTANSALGFSPLGDYVEIEATAVGSNKDRFTLEGDTTGSEFFVGLEYNMEYEMASPALREDSKMGGRTHVMNMRNQIRNGKVSYENTGYFEITVKPKGRDAFSSVFKGSPLGDSNGLNLQQNNIVKNGVFKFPVLSRAEDVEIKILNPTYLPVQLISAEFESFVNGTSRRTSR